MRYSFLFVTVLILVSGFIAYFGDMLGRWMGKKRLTLLNLRPRHTAYIVTAITGMLIAALTLTALVSANLQFRKVLTQGEHILTRNEALTKTNAALTAQNQDLESRRKVLQDRVKRQRKDVEVAEDRALKAAEAQLKAAETVKRLEKDIASRKREIEARQHQLELLRKKSAGQKAELEARMAELTHLQLQLSNAQSALAGAQRSYANALDLQAKARKDLADTRARLEQARQDADEQEKLLREQQAALVRTGKEVLEARTEAVEFYRQKSELLGGDIRFSQGDEIARGTISPRQSVFAIRGDIFSLLGTAGDNARNRGAEVGPNGRAVVVVTPTQIGEGYILWSENERESVPAAAEAIARSAFQPYDALVQVLCARNSLAGEQVRVRLVLYYNKLVYRKGDKIAETKMDGLVSEGRVLLALIGFLQNEVSKAAMDAGIVPVANPDPRATLGSDPRTQVEGLMAAVDQIKSKKSKVNVEAYACADVYAVGPLNMTNMRFSVSKIE